jgi:16S rRNA processing protein RimM
VPRSRIACASWSRATAVSEPRSLPSRLAPDAVLVLGRILGPHGLRGEVRVRSYTEPPESLLAHRSWLLRSPEGHERRVEVLSSRHSGVTLRVALGGVADRDAADRLRNHEVLIERSALPATAAREFYQEDLLGFSVRNLEGTVLGELVYFVEAPTGALMVVRGRREHWLPAQAPRLRRVDLARRELVVDWPEDI